MPNLERQAVMDWISVCEPAVSHTCITLIRALEDAPDNRAALVALGDALDHHAATGAGLAGLLQSGEPLQDLQAVMTQLGPARLLRLLHWIAQEDKPDRSEILRMLLGGTDATATSLRATVHALHRMTLLSRIFDETRLEVLLVASKAAREDSSA